MQKTKKEELSHDPAEVLSRALEKVLRGDAAERKSAYEKIREVLGTDELNARYFVSLYLAQDRSGRARKVKIYDPEAGRKADAARSDELVLYPTTTAPAELMRELPIHDYAKLRKEAAFPAIARQAAVWLKKMQAGTGSSMTRASYIAARSGVPLGEVRLSAKGTDLHVPLQGKERALAEIQLLRAFREAESEFGQVILHDIVSSETKGALEAIWAPYVSALRDSRRVSRFRETEQAHIPTLDPQGRVSFRRKAPGGHALFFVDAMRAAYRPELRPESAGPLIGAISNGEDLNSSPDPYMVGLLVRERIGLALVMTEAMPVDLKGGKLGLARLPDGTVYATVIETAQAKEAGQLALFERLEGIANTNLVLVNYDTLAPRISRLVDEIGEEEFLSIITPDLILNRKKQVDEDGVEREYTQLEGAMGSSLMNLDRYWRSKYHEPLVHIIKVDRDLRTDFFSPIKSAFDFFMQFHSDRFRLNPETLKVDNLRPGALPVISLKDPATGDKFYQDVKSVLDAFAGLSIRELDRLEIEGQVTLRKAKLVGDVRIVNATGRAASLDSLTLADERVVIGTDGRLDRAPLA